MYIYVFGNNLYPEQTIYDFNEINIVEVYFQMLLVFRRVCDLTHDSCSSYVPSSAILDLSNTQNISSERSNV